MTRTLGVVGGGQLGRLFVESARRLGFETAVLDPDPHCPASLVVDHHHVAGYDDAKAVRAFAEQCEAVTVEFENVPIDCLDLVASLTTMRPAPAAVAIAADRRREKQAITSIGAPVAPYEVIEQAADIDRIGSDGSLVAEGGGVVVKTAQLGYDGKGQIRLDDLDGLGVAWSGLGRVPCVVERLLPLDRELSVVIARDHGGEIVSYAPAVNEHVHGILDASVVVADDPLAQEARDTACRLADHLEYVGVLAVEFFVSVGRLFVNEIAPRPHNSGHWTIDGAVTSQFEQQARVLAGLPLGDTTPTRGGIAMVNLLGDLWATGEPRWQVLDGIADAHLHLYGKREARPGRKMGHLTVLGDDPQAALATARALRARVVRP